MNREGFWGEMDYLSLVMKGTPTCHPLENSVNFTAFSYKYQVCFGINIAVR